MASLRQRFLLAVGLLLGMQLSSAALAVGSWQWVRQGALREQELTEWRAQLATLGFLVREQYVHQAHTYIEGGPGHLDHGAGVELKVEAALAGLTALPFSEEEQRWLQQMRQDQQLLNAYFQEKVAPIARTGSLDRATALEFHAVSERLTKQLTDAVDVLSASLDKTQAEERRIAQERTEMAGQATVWMAIASLLTAVAVARELTRAVLAPVEAIRAAAQQYGESGRPLGDELSEVAAAFDILSKRLAEAEKHRIQTERLAALGEMSAAVAHELLNPLAVILAQSKADTQEGTAIRDEAQHARRVVEGLLGFARPQAEDKAEVELLEWTKRAVDRLVPMADAAGVGLEVRGEAVVCACSPTAIRQVLDNLVRNAVEAIPPDGRVEVEIDPRGPTIRVLDRGPGLATSVRQRLYQPFVTGKARGTGLGLAIAHRVATAMGGSLEHRDREGGGTEVVWRLA